MYTIKYIMYIGMYIYKSSMYTIVYIMYLYIYNVY